MLDLMASKSFLYTYISVSYLAMNPVSSSFNDFSSFSLLAILLEGGKLSGERSQFSVSVLLECFLLIGVA